MKVCNFLYIELNQFLWDNPQFSKDDFYFSANKNKFTTYLTETEKELTKYIDGENRFKTTLPNVKLDAYSFKS